MKGFLGNNETRHIFSMGTGEGKAEKILGNMGHGEIFECKGAKENFSTEHRHSQTSPLWVTHT
jgi:hypothetical protein